MVMAFYSSNIQFPAALVVLARDGHLRRPVGHLAAPVAVAPEVAVRHALAVVPEDLLVEE